MLHLGGRPVVHGAELILQSLPLPVGMTDGKHRDTLEKVRIALRIYQPPAVSHFLGTEKAC